MPVAAVADARQCADPERWCGDLLETLIDQPDGQLVDSLLRLVSATHLEQPTNPTPNVELDGGGISGRLPLFVIGPILDREPRRARQRLFLLIPTPSHQGEDGATPYHDLTQGRQSLDDAGQLLEITVGSLLPAPGLIEYPVEGRHDPPVQDHRRRTDRPIATLNVSNRSR